MQRRPRAITVVAAFLFAATVIAVVVGLALLFPGRLLDWLADLNRPGMAVFRVAGRWSGLFLLALAAGTGSAAVGLRRGRRWAWWFAVVLFVMDGAGDLVSYAVTRDVVRSLAGVAICLVFLYALSRPAVRDFCRNRVS